MSVGWRSVFLPPSLLAVLAAALLFLLLRTPAELQVQGGHTEVVYYEVSATRQMTKRWKHKAFIANTSKTQNAKVKTSKTHESKV